MKNVLEWLEYSAQAYPEKTAFADESLEVTFSELEEGAKRIGTALAEKIEPRNPVSFYLEKSTIAIQGMFGAVYAGAFYSLFDVRQPEARIRKILGILQPSVILTDRANEDKAKKLFSEDSAEILVIEELLAETKAEEAVLSGIREQALDIDPLYVNFTSGSTGTPKGVAVSHRSVIDFIEPFTELFGITERDVIGNQAPFDFDVSVKDIFSGIRTGAAVQIIPRGYFSFPTKLMDYLADREVTTLIWAVSAMCFVSIMNGFEYRLPEKVNKVMFSGEVMPIKQLNVWKHYLPDAMYVNLYGPTEITCNCTYHILDRDYAEEDVIPIGKAFPNEKVFLLNEAGQQVTEVGKAGEICVSGTTLALGYYRNPEKTAEAFVQNPLNTAYPEMIYRTGDLGRLDADGNLIYISRKDFQIKHMGHRIELGEIESAAQSLPGISRACCLYDRNKQRLLLFYTGEAEKKAVARSLRKALPPFMIPNAVTPLAEMPMTKNGKIDRALLKEMGGIS